MNPKSHADYIRSAYAKAKPKPGPQPTPLGPRRGAGGATMSENWRYAIGLAFLALSAVCYYTLPQAELTAKLAPFIWGVWTGMTFLGPRSKR